MTRVLAVIHMALALGAFGIGNAALGGVWDAPTVLHLLFGLVLLLSAVTLWTRGKGLRWAVALTLGLGALVAFALLQDRIEGVGELSVGLTTAAIAFLALEIFTLKYAPPPKPRNGGAP